MIRRHIKTKLFILALCFTVVNGVATSHAETTDATDDSALGKLIDVLRENGTIDAKSHASLSKEIKDITDQKAAAAAAAPKIDTNGRFQITSADGKSMFRAGGRIHLDGAIYNDASEVGFTNAFDVRRARIELQGIQYTNWEWKLDYEFAQHSDVQSGFRDLFIRYRVPNSTNLITVGQFKEFFGLESLNSSNDLPFVERALTSRTFLDIAESIDGRRLGIGWNANDTKLFTTSLGAFARNVSGDSYDEEGDPFAVEGRLTASPIHTSTEVLHAGLSVNWIDINNPSNAKLSARPEAKIGTIALVSTGTIENAESMARYGGELGVVEGPIWSQAEYMVATINRSEDPSLLFSGWYANLGYVLTGESRRYSFDKGTFSNPKVARTLENGGWGAFEVASRLSGLNLTDKDIQGGRETNFSLGLNWFPNDNYKFMLTWTQVLDVVGGAYDGQTPSEILLRAQFAF